MTKVWFITGASRGFGRIWAEAALSRGDLVAATARDTRALEALREKAGDRLLPLPLDVTDRSAAVEAVDRAHSYFGRLDVVVNNAGYGLFGAVEDIGEEQARRQMDTNVLGTLWVTQAALPHLRAAGTGHIINVSSVGGVVAWPLFALYNATKFAVEGLSEGLAKEVAGFGIKVTMVEPGFYATDWGRSSSVQAHPSPAYEALTEERAALGASVPQGDPTATAPAILELVDSSEPPLRLFLGDGPLTLAKAAYAQRLAEWEKWNHLAVLAQGSQA
ncbi:MULTISPECIES: SDR family NAD(P)-dependent oxidoreductase [unclassified Streptomyces]|uniref:SDR family NAD(P)-dependent oxidoreductase n=1 Tax=unclassified Streptomyces TaxID=2593676 RepID=UPI003829562D